MPPKVRQLRTDLQRAGFREEARRGKESHTWWEHPNLPEFPVNLAGQDGNDAKPYQIRDVRQAQTEKKEGTMNAPAEQRYAVVIE